MWIARYALPVGLVLSVLFACLAPRTSEPAESIPAQELLVRAQLASDRNYTYSQATAAALGSVRVPRPEEAASAEALESALKAAGFDLVAVGPPKRALFLVERATR